MRNPRGGLRDTQSRGRAGAKPASARFRRRKARGWVFGLRHQPARRMEIAAYPNPPCSDLTSKCTGRTTSLRVPCPYGLGRPAMSGASRPPVGGGNGGHVEMAECLISAQGAGSHFQPSCRKFKRRRKVEISRSPGPFSPTRIYWWRSTTRLYWWRSTTRPRTLPPLFKSLSAALASFAGRVSIGIGGTLPA